MDLNFFLNNYLPDKLAYNPNSVNRIQKKNPIIFGYNDMAYNKMKGKIADLFNIKHNKSIFNKQMPEKFMKGFFFSFVIIYLLSFKLSILHYENEYTKEKNPRLGRIITICVIISFISILIFTKK